MKTLTEIPNDLLHLIFKMQLLSFHGTGDDQDQYHDYTHALNSNNILSYAIASTSWRSILKNFYDPIKLKTPPLILLAQAGGYHYGNLACQNNCHLFNTIRQQLHKIQLPELYRKWVSACSRDWLVTIGYDSPHRVSLFNPLSRARVRLPPALNGLGGRRVHEIKLNLSCNPLDSNCFVMARFCDDTRLSICQPGDRRWTRVVTDSHQNYKYSSSIFYKGEFYIIGHGDSNILTLFLCKNLDRLVMIVEKSIPKPRDCVSTTTYMVESSGDLLLVLKYNYWDDPQVSGIGGSYAYQCRPRIIFEIYKLEDGKFVEVNDIGDNAIYLSSNCSISMTGTNIEERRGNTIYFFDDLVDVGYMTGVYGVKDTYVELTYQSSPAWTTPVTWFTPDI